MKMHIGCAASALMIIAALAGCVSTPRELRVESEEFEPRTSQPEQVIFKTAGDSGQEFEGYLNLDGTMQRIAGTSPAAFPLEVNILIGEISKSRGHGTLSFSIENSPKTRSVSFGRLKSPGDKLRFGYHDGAIEAHSE